MNWLKKIWLCKIWGWHNWTTNFKKRGNKPADIDPKTISDKEFLKHFLDDCVMYCDRCEHISEVSLEFQHKMREKFGVSDDFKIEH